MNYSDALADFVKTVLESHGKSSVDIHINKDYSKINFNIVIEETKEEVKIVKDVKDVKEEVKDVKEEVKDVKGDVKEEVKEEVKDVKDVKKDIKDIKGAKSWDEIRKEVEEFEKGCKEAPKKIDILPYDPTESVHCEIINGKHNCDDTASKLFDNYNKSNDTYVGLRAFPKRDIPDISNIEFPIISQ